MDPQIRAVLVLVVVIGVIWLIGAMSDRIRHWRNAYLEVSRQLALTDTANARLTAANADLTRDLGSWKRYAEALEKRSIATNVRPLRPPA